MITHPFHPLTGQPVEVVGRERRGGRDCFRCLGGPLGTIVVQAEWTDRSHQQVGEGRLTYEVLVELAAAAATIRR